MVSDFSTRFAANLPDWPPRESIFVLAYAYGVHRTGHFIKPVCRIDPVLAVFLLIRFMNAAFRVFVRHLTIFRLPGYMAFQALALGLDAAASKSTMIGSETYSSHRGYCVGPQIPQTLHT